MSEPLIKFISEPNTGTIYCSIGHKSVSDINKELIECMNRELGKEKGGKAPYFPNKEEGKKNYKEFMNYLGSMLGVSERYPDRVECVVVPSIDGYYFNFVNKKTGGLLQLMKAY